jgi:hypothetical protein
MDDNEKLRTALVELRELRSENKAMIDLAGEAIGTDPSLRSSVCVEVLTNHVETLRKELRELREQDERTKKFMDAFNAE